MTWTEKEPWIQAEVDLPLGKDKQLPVRERKQEENVEEAKDRDLKW